MAEHTPGPWKVTTNLDYWVEPVNFEGGEGEFKGIALCGDIHWPNSNEKQFEWEANARLIAAAPDMLEALKAALCDAEGGDVPTQATIDAMNAAITKAEGGAG